MSQNASRVIVPNRTYVYLAQVGTVAPANAAAALDTGWREVGYTTPDSLSFATEPEFEEINTAQSDYPVRRFLTQEAATLSVDLLEWSGENFKALYGGGAVTDLGSGQFKFTPPANTRQEVSALVEIRDGATVYRYIFPRTLQIEGVEGQLSKGQQNGMALRLAILGADGVDPWYVLTNSAAFAAGL